MIVACDIDGCLADVAPYVVGYLMGEKKDWKGYFSHTGRFPPVEGMVSLINTLLFDHKVVFVSGRPSSNRRATRKWLKRHIHISKGSKLRLYLRKDGDRRSGSELKLEIYRKLALGDTLLVIDDEPTTVEMASKEGFLSLQVMGFRATSNDHVPPEEG